MDNDARVTVRLDENGQLAGLQIDGEIDKSTLVEERRPEKVLPVTQDVTDQTAIRLGGI